MCNFYLFSIFFPRHFENENVASRSPLSLVEPRPKHEPPCVISQQRFRPPGLMAQCSLYDVRCLKGSSVLLFCSNLIPKLFKHQGFSSTRSIQSVCLSVWGREGAGGRNRQTKRPVRIADTVFIWLSCFFCVSPADLEQISIIIYLYLYNFQKEPHIYTARRVGLLRQRSAPSHDRRGYCRVSPSASSDSNAGEGMSFNSQGCLKKNKNTTSLC